MVVNIIALNLEIPAFKTASFMGIPIAKFLLNWSNITTASFTKIPTSATTPQTLKVEKGFPTIPWPNNALKTPTGTTIRINLL